MRNVCLSKKAVLTLLPKILFAHASINFILPKILFVHASINFILYYNFY